jgi:dTDP-4-amino-4,6-dideoxygalactose transaminase
MIKWVANKPINHDRVRELLNRSVQINQFTNGSPAVEALETAVRTLLNINNTKSIVCVSNGTVALWATIAAIEVYYQKDLRFFTQSFTFPASAQGYLQNVGIVDIDISGGLNLEEVPLDQCDGIIVTNIFGNVADISKYEEWCKNNNKILVLDNAATSNTTYKGMNSCNYGSAATLSFHHTKPIGFGEGGCIIIDHKYERCLRDIINFGIDNSSPTGKWHRKGGNYKMSDLQAVYISQYLDNFDEIVNKTKKLYEYFLDCIAQHSNIKPFPNFSDDTPFVSCICVLVDNSCDKIAALLKNNIYCRKYYNPLVALPVATDVYNRIICIPCTVDMSTDDIDRILNILI